jgi:hypothetical protein
VRRFSIVPICSNRPFIMFFSSCMSLLCWRYWWCWSDWFLCVWGGGGCFGIWAYVTPGWLYKVCFICASGVYIFERRGGMFSSVGPCGPYIPCSSQGDYRHRGHIGRHSIFPFGGIDLSSCYRRNWHTSVSYDSNFLCTYIVGSLHIGQCPFYVWAVLIVENDLVDRGRV